MSSYRIAVENTSTELINIEEHFNLKW
jgi:hypothetical protein